MHFDIHGQSAQDARTVIMSSGLGGSGAYWTPQIQVLAQHFRVVTYDHRGTGKTGGDVPDSGGIAAMADDVLEIAGRIGLKRFDFIGHALGGLIGLELALCAPQAINSLVLINAWSKADPHSGRCFDIRVELLEKSGIEAFVKAQPLFLYPAAWMSDNADRMAADEAHGIAHFQGKANVLRRIAALRAFDVDSRLGAITVPTLLIAAKDDLLVPYTRSQRLANGIEGSKLLVMGHGAHAVNITEADAVNGFLESFLLGATSTEPRSARQGNRDSATQNLRA